VDLGLESSFCEIFNLVNFFNWSFFVLQVLLTLFHRGHGLTLWVRLNWQLY